MIYEDQNSDKGTHQWHEITTLAYGELKQIPLSYEASIAFIQSNPVDVLPKVGARSR